MAIVMQLPTERTDGESCETTDRAPAARCKASAKAASRPPRPRAKAVSTAGTGKPRRDATQAHRSADADGMGRARREAPRNGEAHHRRRHEPAKTREDSDATSATSSVEAAPPFRPRWDGDTPEGIRSESVEPVEPPHDPASPEAAQPRRRAWNDPAVLKVLNQQASVLENVFFPLQVIKTLGIEQKASVLSVRIFLGRFREQAGFSGDAVEKLLLDELCLAHLKSGELHALAAASTTLEYKQLYLSSQSRLVGAICQLVSTLTNYRSAQRRNAPSRKKAKATRRSAATRNARVPKRDRKPKKEPNEQGC